MSSMKLYELESGTFCDERYLLEEYIKYTEQVKEYNLFVSTITKRCIRE